MKILHIISRLETGGAQKLLSELLPALSDCGVKADVLVFSRLDNHIEKALTEAGINIISLDIANLRSPALIPKLRKYIARYDLAHVHLFPALYECALAACGLKTPLVYTEHSTSNRRRDKKYMRPAERLVYSAYRKIVAISPQTEKALADWIGPSLGRRIVTIENGINLEKIRDAGSASFPDGKPTILMVSRFNESKDQKTLIRALPLIDDKSIRVAFAGDGPNLEECRREAVRRSVADRVSFLGNRTDVPQLINGALLGVQSSNWEGFGLTAVELMAAGKPVVASDVDGLKQVVDGYGLLFKAGKHEDLARQINRLLSNEKLFAEVAEKCYRRADMFSIDKMAERYALLYSQILEKQPDRS